MFTRQSQVYLPYLPRMYLRGRGETDAATDSSRLVLKQSDIGITPPNQPFFQPLPYFLSYSGAKSLIPWVVSSYGTQHRETPSPGGTHSAGKNRYQCREIYNTQGIAERGKRWRRSKIMKNDCRNQYSIPEQVWTTLLLEGTASSSVVDPK